MVQVHPVCHRNHPGSRERDAGRGTGGIRRGGLRPGKEDLPDPGSVHGVRNPAVLYLPIRRSVVLPEPANGGGVQDGVGEVGFNVMGVRRIIGSEILQINQLVIS